LRLLESPPDQLTRAYGQWCNYSQHQPGDCLRILNEGPLIGSDGKYTLAMAIAMGRAASCLSISTQGQTDWSTTRARRGSRWLGLTAQPWQRARASRNLPASISTEGVRRALADPYRVALIDIGLPGMGYLVKPVEQDALVKILEGSFAIVRNAFRQRALSNSGTE
jgi:hypothetical protein